MTVRKGVDLDLNTYISLAPRTDETLYINGDPYEVFELDGVAAEARLFGAINSSAGRVWLHLDDLTPRKLRGAYHEIIHGLDDAFRLHLSHEQVRRLAAGLSVTLRDRRNHTERLGPLL